MEPIESRMRRYKQYFLITVAIALIAAATCLLSPHSMQYPGAVVVVSGIFACIAGFRYIEFYHYRKDFMEIFGVDELWDSPENYPTWRDKCCETVLKTMRQLEERMDDRKDREEKQREYWEARHAAQNFGFHFE